MEWKVGSIFRLGEAETWSLNGGGEKTGAKNFPKGHLFRIEALSEHKTSIISSLIDPEEKINIRITLPGHEDNSMSWSSNHIVPL